MGIYLLCKNCETNNLVKIGKSSSGQQRYKCKNCNNTMQLNYLKTGYDPSIKEKIVLMAHNGTGVRQTGRILNISKDTVSKVLKKNQVFKSK